jgi:16S rRNA (uracil1498-N3)-methyltransferase
MVRRGEAELAGDEAEHLTRVLRAEPGQRYEIGDGSRLYLGEIIEARKRLVRFRVIEELPVPEPAVRTTLLASLIKFDRFEWMVEKATELGVETIVPVQAERTELGLQLAARKRAERWNKIARAAAQQSRRVRAPQVAGPVSLREAAQMAAERRFYLEETPGPPMLLGALGQAASTIAILVGPEGGWTDRERQNLIAAGWIAVSLGPQILRAETAAVAAMAIVTSALEATSPPRSLPAPSESPDLAAPPPHLPSPHRTPD